MKTQYNTVTAVTTNLIHIYVTASAFEKQDAKAMASLRKEYADWAMDNRVNPVRGGHVFCTEFGWAEIFYPNDAKKVIAWLVDHQIQMDVEGPQEPT